MELALPGGFVRTAVNAVPWAGQLPQRPEHFSGSGVRRVVSLVADFAISHRYGAVLAPAHYLVEGASDEWRSIDLWLVTELRHELDRRGGSETRIYYPLAMPGTVLRDATHLQAIIRDLRGLDIDAIWLRIHPFGTSHSGAHVLRGYIEAAELLHSLQIPLVAERVGTVGLPLLAFGAVGGIESGITVGEQFNALPLLHAPSTRRGAFAPPPRVYLNSLGGFLSREQARNFFSNRRVKAKFACTDATCCRRGFVDMVENPRRHFLISRDREVNALARAPLRLRSALYMTNFLRPASDLAVRAAKVEPALERVAQRLESWHAALSALLESGQPASFSPAAVGRRLRTQQAAPRVVKPVE